MIDHMVMYNSNVRALPFPEQCRAAGLAGCSELAIGPIDFRGNVAAGWSAQDMRHIASDHGVTLSHLDPFACWTPVWMPGDGMGSVDISFMSFSEDEFLRISDALGCISMTALGTYPKGTYPVSEAIDLFGAFCERAARHGLRVNLEFVPFFGIDTLEAAWEIVSGANAANGGIMFDTWHHRRSGSTDAFLATIPGARITGVQVNDGDATASADVSPLEECVTRRRMPGEGEFRVRETLAVLEQTGGLNNVGPEVFSPDLDALSAEEIAARCRACMAAVLP